MGTRGTVSIIYKKECKPIRYYVCWDSYPSGLGESLVKDIRLLLSKHSVEELIEMFSKVKEQQTDFTMDQIKEIKMIVGPTYADERKAQMDQYYISRGLGPVPDHGIDSMEVCEIQNRLGHSLCFLLKFGKYLDHPEEEDRYEDYDYFIDFSEMTFRCKSVYSEYSLHDDDEKVFPLNDIPTDWCKE